MKIRITNNNAVNPFSTDIEGGKGEMIRLLVPPGGSVEAGDIDPFYLNQDKNLRDVVASGDLTIAFVAEPGDLVAIASGGSQTLSWKDAVRVTTTANIALSGLLTIDGVVLVAGDRVLVKSQATGAQNGIYVAASGAWTRAEDADTGSELKAGSFAVVTEGTTNADTAWFLTTNNPIVVGTTVQTWAQFTTGGGPAVDDNRAIKFSIQGNPPSVGGPKGPYFRVPWDLTVLAWTLSADQVGSVVLDVWRSIDAGFPPVNAGTITGIEKPTLTAQQKASDTTLTTWTVDLDFGDWLAFEVESVSGVRKVELTLDCVLR